MITKPMRLPRLPLIVMVVLIHLSIIQAAYYYPRLPDTVASHFGPSGQADGWMNKGAFFGFMMGTTFMLSTMFLATSIAPVWISARRFKQKQGSANEADESAVPAQTSTAKQQLVELFARLMSWTGVATIGFLLILFQMVYQANLSPKPAIPYFWVVLPIYLMLLAGLTMQAAGQYSRLKKDLPPRAPLPPDIWFPAKRFGYGWGLPVRWQGWVFMIASGAIFTIGTTWLAAFEYFALATVFFIAMLVLLFVVCIIKGEKLRWRWGDDD